MKKAPNYLVIVIIFSCVRTQNEKLVYDENGRITAKFVYLNKKDTTSYTYYEYYENGNVHYKSIVFEGQFHGTFTVFNEEGLPDTVLTYSNDRLHGVAKVFNPYTHQLLRETLYIDGKELIRAEYFWGVTQQETPGDTIFGLGYWYNIDKRSETPVFFPVGSIVWDDIGDIIHLRNSYYDITAKDTVSFGEHHRVKIVFRMGLAQNISFTLTLGELDENLKFISPHSIKSYKSVSDSLILDIADYKLGTNLILGKIKIFQNGKNVTTLRTENEQIEDYIFFHQFEVVE